MYIISSRLSNRQLFNNCWVQSKYHSKIRCLQTFLKLYKFAGIKVIACLFVDILEAVARFPQSQHSHTPVGSNSRLAVGIIQGKGAVLSSLNF